ncbi:MAG: hypothetical protein HWN66_17425 [Candidatus Helarchaeota archaeon]|nr:hypothetical protein [Candidatus Helarchaeota archaeon]
MKVNELQPGMRKVEVIVKVVKKEPSRDVFVKRDGTKHKVANLKVGDETGLVTMSLWDEMINQIHEDDVIRISNGYVSEFGGEIQLNIGRYGTWERLDQSEYDMDVYLEKIESTSSLAFIQLIDVLRRERGINVIVKVIDQLPVRQVTTRRDGKRHNINTFVIGDETGVINFVLWDKGDDIAVSDILEIHGGYTRDFNNVLELNLSRTGSYQKSSAEVREVNNQRNLSEPSS